MSTAEPLRARGPLYRHIQQHLQDRITRGEWVRDQALTTARRPSYLIGPPAHPRVR